MCLLEAKRELSDYLRKDFQAEAFVDMQPISSAARSDEVPPAPQAVPDRGRSARRSKSSAIFLCTNLLFFLYFFEKGRFVTYLQ
jgi:hypothetical protein